MKRAFGWLVVGSVAVPLGILLHELGHLAAAFAVGYDTPRLEGITATYGTAGHSDYQRGLVAVSGPLVTLLLTLIGWLLGQRYPLARLLSLAASVRGLLWLGVAVMVARGIGKVNGGDEFVLSQRWGWPLELTTGLSVVLAFGSLIGLARVPKPLRGAAWAGVAGVVLGAVASLVAGV